MRGPNFSEFWAKHHPRLFVLIELNLGGPIVVIAVAHQHSNVEWVLDAIGDGRPLIFQPGEGGQVSHTELQL